MLIALILVAPSEACEYLTAYMNCWTEDCCKDMQLKKTFEAVKAHYETTDCKVDCGSSGVGVLSASVLVIMGVVITGTAFAQYPSSI